METGNENFETNRSDLFAFFIESFYLYTQSIARTISQVMRGFLENAQIAEFIDVVSNKFEENPFFRFMAIATAMCCAIPVVMFIVFGIVTLIVTFSGFLFVQGTLLAVGGLCLFICTVSLVMVMSVLAATLAVLYLLTLKLGVILHKLDPSFSFFGRNFRQYFAEREVLEISNSVSGPHQD